MKSVKENALNANPDLWKELNEVLNKYELGDVFIESIRLKGGTYEPHRCRRVCRLWRNPRTGETKVVCTVVC